ncbi:MAG: hypothetical protein CL955_10970 [Erythrobacteraceae bacterium]|nr:hypothetical protein [Erythrobacteraceae bacterium]
MKFANVGSADRMIRLILGVIFAAIPFVVGSIEPASTLGIVSFVAAGIMVVTATVKFCPIYGIFGLRTSPKS